MSKKTNKEYTPGDKARQFTLGSLARVGACAYLIYVIVNLIVQASKGETGVSLPVMIIITAVIAVLGIYLIFITIKEVIRGVKNKEYSMHKYYSDELTAQGLKYNAKGELVPIDTPDEEEEEPAEVEKAPVEEVIEDDDDDEYEYIEEEDYVEDSDEE